MSDPTESTTPEPTDAALMDSVTTNLSGAVTVLGDVLKSHTQLEEDFDALCDVLVAKGVVTWDELKTQRLRNRADCDQAAGKLAEQADGLRDD